VSRRVAALLAAALVLIVVTGCGGGGSSSSSSEAKTTGKTNSTLPAPPEPPPNAEEGTVFVSLGSAKGLGEVLVNSEGRTLYAFSGDAKAPTCEGACAKAWPPLLDENGEPQPSNGTAAARLGTVERPDGTTQVTYAGHPLYSFGGDKLPGQAEGNGESAFGGTWTALKGSGEPAS
jgi:predicted lipoprotein with Yx(FWY)xxD motif